MTKTLSDYGKIYSILEPAMWSQFASRVVDIEEKVDGSQLSVHVSRAGELTVCSRKRNIPPDSPGMFLRAMDTINDLKHKLTPDMIYVFEYLTKRKHNVISYTRIPTGGLVLFDYSGGMSSGCCRETVEKEAEAIGVDCVPLLYSGPMLPMDELKSLLDQESHLGGHNIEGLVIKDRFDTNHKDKKMLKAKLVSDEFKERMSAGSTDKLTKKTADDVIALLSSSLKAEARYEKAVQKVKEADGLTESMRDVGSCMKALGEDLREEHMDAIKQELFLAFWPRVQKEANADFARWYAARLESSCDLN